MCAGCRLYAEVVRLALEALNQVPAREGEHHQRHQDAEEPVGSPNIEFFHPCPCDLFCFSSGLSPFTQAILRYPPEKTRIFLPATAETSHEYRKLRRARGQRREAVR